MITFYWIDLVIIPGIVQGLLLALMLFRTSKGSLSANRPLSIILLMATIMLIGRLVWNRYPPEWAMQWSLVPDTIIFLFGPFILFYIQRLLGQKEVNSGLPKYHFVPAVIHLLIVCYLLSYSKTEFDTMLRKGQFNFYFLVTEGIAIVLNIIYWFLSYAIIRRYNHLGREKISFDQAFLSYLKTFHFVIAACLILWTLGFINGIWLQARISFINYDMVWTAIPIFIYIIGYYGLSQSKLFTIGDEIHTRKLMVDRLRPREIAELKNALNEVMSNKKVFTKNNLTLPMLAKELDTTYNNVSWLLNEVYGKSFYDYVNHLRIREFLKKLERDEHHQKTLLALATEVGFNSKSTFNRAFKFELKDTPSNYIKRFNMANLHKGYPIQAIDYN